MADLPSHVQSIPSSHTTTSTTASLNLIPRPIAIKSVSDPHTNTDASPRLASQSPTHLFPVDSSDPGSTNLVPSCDTKPLLAPSSSASRVQAEKHHIKIPPLPPPPLPAVSSNLFQPPRQYGESVEPIPMICTSKKWVLPPRPKPGRKPSQDPPAVKRKAQNRAAQKAYRERRAAAAAASSAGSGGEATLEPIKESAKKKKPVKKVKEEVHKHHKQIKKEPPDEEQPISLATLNLNEPSMDIKIKQEELFSMASCIDSVYIKPEDTSEGLAARQFSNTLRSSNSPELNEEEATMDDDEDDKSRNFPSTIKGLRAALSAANFENQRLSILVNELRTEVAILKDMKDLKVAEKAFLYDEPQFPKGSGNNRNLKQSILPAPPSQGCGLCEAGGDCVCDKLGLKANPFFGDQEAGKQSVLLNVDVFLNDNDDITPQDPVPLRKRGTSTAKSSSMLAMPKFKRLQDDYEMDFTNAFSLRNGSTNESWNKTKSQTAVANTLLTGSSEISPGSDEASASTPMTSDDEVLMTIIPPISATMTTTPSNNNNDTNTQPYDFHDQNTSSATTATTAIKKGKRVVSAASSAACCRTNKKVCTEHSQYSNNSLRSSPKPKPKSKSKVNKIIIDPCGFCSNGTPCLCAEAAEQADSSDFE